MLTLPPVAARRRDRLRGDNIVVRSSRLAIYLSLICSLFLVLTACRVPGAVRPTVKIGLVAPFEGRYRHLGYDLLPAVRLAVQEANDAGGVEGVGVELIAYDDGADPDAAIVQARKLVIDPDVMVVIGHFQEGTTGAALPVYTEAGMPVVTLEPVAGGAGVVSLGPAPEDLAGRLLDGLESGVLLDGGGALGRALRREAEERGIALAPVVTPGEPGWLEIVLESAPEVVLCDADPVTAGEAVAALRAAGWEGGFLGGPSLGMEDFVSVAGAAAEGARFVAPSRSLDQLAYEAARLVLDGLAADITAEGTPTRAGMASALAARAEGRSCPLAWYEVGE